MALTGKTMLYLVLPWSAMVRSAKALLARAMSRSNHSGEVRPLGLWVLVCLRGARSLVFIVDGVVQVELRVDLAVSAKLGATSVFCGREHFFAMERKKLV